MFDGNNVAQSRRTIIAMSRELAIDLGTANTLIYAKGKGIIFNEPSLVAMESKTHKILAIGDEAWDMIGRTHRHVVAVRPVRQGSIMDLDVVKRMFGLLLKRAGASRLNRPHTLVSVPFSITGVEGRAIKEAARKAGSASCRLIEQPIAAAIGAGLAINEPIGSMIVDVGGGKSEMAVISLGGMVSSRTLRCGGSDLDTAIQTYVRNEFGVVIGERLAERVKLAIGSLITTDKEELRVEIRGRTIDTGIPETIVLSRGQVSDAIENCVAQIVNSTVECLGNAPAEFSQDILFQGIHLVGGTSLLPGLAERIERATSVPVHRVEFPLETVVRGAGFCLESSTQFEKLVED